MTDPWYSVNDADAPLSQGDLVLSCPVSSWMDEPIVESEETDQPWLGQEMFEADVILMTQACDLANDKLRNVILCPAEPISAHEKQWVQASDAAGPKAWKKHLERIRKGHQWNYAIIDSFESEEITDEARIVDFHEIYTLPKSFVKSHLSRRGGLRLQLRSPYREHLSQSFARYFMRVGLPSVARLPV